MQKVEVKVTPIGGDGRSMRLCVESKRGDGWSRDTVADVTSGQPDAAATYNLRDNQRLVVEFPEATEEMVYDRDSFGAIRPSAQSQSETRADRPTTELSKEEKQKFEHAAIADRVNRITNDAGLADDAGLVESNKPFSRADVAGSKPAKDLQKQEEKKAGDQPAKADATTRAQTSGTTASPVTPKASPAADSSGKPPVSSPSTAGMRDSDSAKGETSAADSKKE